ncbi:MAG: hypothetical protein DI611_05035 [Brachybacterium faecium]|nr:MAG: hypothetical protein DI611_05035 [Brachybacterium faecium]
MTPSNGAPREGDPRDVDEEFARLLEAEGVVLPPGQAPSEPAATDKGERHRLGSPDSPGELPTEEQRARARAVHPALGRPAKSPAELDDDDDLYDRDAWMGDFVPPDPDLPEPSSRALWSWTALVGGVLMLLVVAVSPSLPTWVGGIGGIAALGGIVSLLMRAPRHREDDGVEV